MVTARALDQLSVGIYLVLGWAGVFVTGPLSTTLAPSTLTLLGVGGLVYSIWRHLPLLGESALSEGRGARLRPPCRDAALCGRVRRRGHRTRFVTSAR